MSPVRATCVPPQSSVEKSPILSTRTSSPYFSPNSAMRAEIERVLIRHLVHFGFDVAADFAR